MDAKKNIRFSLIWIILACLLVTVPATSWGATGTLDIRVSQLSDDAEVNAAGNWVSTNINDLEIGDKGCAMRFQNVTIPRGSSITNAYIQFTVHAVNSDTTSVEIWGELSNNPATFSDGGTDIPTLRTPITSKIAWDNVPPWGQAGDSNYAQQTPDISTIIEEIVNFGTWTSGDSIAIYIDGTVGRRVARAFKWAYDNNQDVAPLLHVEYTTNVVEIPISAYDDDAEERADGSMFLDSPDLDILNATDRGMGLRFQNVQVPQGVQITKAYIEMVAQNEGQARLDNPASMVINGEATDDAWAFSYTVNDISSRPLTNQTVTWDPVPAWDLNQTYQTPDISAIVQEIVGRPFWASGNAMAFIFTHGTGWRVAYSYDTGAATNNQAVLRIEYSDDNNPYITTDTNSFGSSIYVGQNPPADALTITNTGSGAMSYTLSDDAAWLSLSSASGSLAPSGSDTITLTYGTAALAAGTHTATLTVNAANAPNSPMEITVSVTILATEDTFSCGHVPVYAENLVSPAIMVLLDISGSMKRKVAVEPGIEDPQTPDLKTIVQEIVNRSGWVSGNAMAFIFEGSGRRTAISYNQDSALGPLLEVTYNNGSDVYFSRRVTAGSDDAEEPIGGFTVDLWSGDLEFVQDGGNMNIVGIRFQNVYIPKGVTIKSASIKLAPDEKDTQPTSLTIWGEDMDNPPTYSNVNNNISARTKTSASVAWNNIPEWDNSTREPKIDIAKSTISHLIQDRAISWGFGSWVGDRAPYNTIPDYTIIHEGCKPADDAHIQAIQDSVNALTPDSNTPFAPSIEAARKYFAGAKPEDEDQATPGDVYVDAECQPKFLINITDGIGNLESTTASVNANTAALADSEVTPIAVGFALPIDQAEQIYEMVKVANQKGDASPTDDIWAMHEVVDDVAQPFFANSKVELIDALYDITESIKGAVFHGSAPAPTTSVDLGDTVIVAQFDASRWEGDVDAVTKDANGQWVNILWSASEVMPANRSIWTIDPADAAGQSVIAYTDATLANDNFDCFSTKPIGDIINSTPVVVGHPPFWYPFDGYVGWASTTSRDTMVYIGANDGSLHAIRLIDGVEQWAFVPKSMHAKLNEAQADPLFDRCAAQYCHQYYVDGSAIVGDVYADFGGASKQWRTILVGGEREGGQAYFALDVTSGKNFGDATDPTTFLWEFTDTQLGQTWSDPSINRVGVKSSTDKDWGVFFGSGYMPNAVDQANKEAYLYGVLANDAGDLWKDASGSFTNRVKVSPTILIYDYADTSFNVGSVLTGMSSGAQGTITKVDSAAKSLYLENVTGTFIVGEELKEGDYANDGEVVQVLSFKNDALSSPLVVDLEGDYVSDRIYVGNLYGNMYRVDNIGKDMTPVVSMLFTYNNTSPNVNPIRAKAEMAYSSTPGEIWVYFGSGIYETQTDKTSSEQQYFFGLKDGLTPAATYEPADLVTLQAKFDVENISGENVTFRYIDGTNPLAQPWKMQLYDGTFPNGPAAVGTERIITQPLVVGGVVFFTTFVPDENICAGSGETWVFAVDYQTGLAVNVPVFDINNDGKWDSNDKVDTDGDGIKDMIPVGILVGRGQGSHPVLHKDTLFITVTGDGNDGGGSGSDDEQFFARKINLPNRKVRVTSWMQN
jgi:Tfp pilus tip-associated adhesin PilY1